MEVFLSLILGYAFGCLNPAAWVGKRNNINLKETGTGNLGATNTTMVLGRKAGAFVLIFDVAKSFLAARLARWLFPQLAVSGMLACIGVILGHCFPVTMHFSGGKGLAAFGGMMLAYNPLVFVIVVLSGIGIMVLLDTGVAAPLLGTVLFPVLAYVFSRDIPTTVCSVIASAIILYTHLENVHQARDHSDIPVQHYFRDFLFKRSKKK
ncbi:MAG: glycerol-3-phosphate acyltransferase [Eubacteriales bacterium]|nr:glycerol-3-phosphate acyltransferase [Eubacteriales bacterium]